jgi:hypothetical protein
VTPVIIVAAICQRTVLAIVSFKSRIPPDKDTRRVLAYETAVAI